MSLEAALEANTAAVKELTAALLSGSGKVEASTKATKASAADKPKATRAGKADKVPSVAELKKVAEGFLEDAKGNEAHFKARRALITDIRAEFGDLAKLSDAAEGDRAAIIERIKDYAEENPVTEDEDEGEGGDI